jgi:helix-turn-helix protein
MTEVDGALLARKTWRTIEPLHGMVYFVPEAAEAYAKLGIEGRDGYFASRAAPMGAVSAEVVISTFFNFNPELVHAAIPSAWSTTTPEALVAARFDAVDGACRRLLGDDVVTSPEMRRAAELARGMAEHASKHVGGRPLCAGHADLPWPDAPHLVLWHAQSILREFRGDGHVALLVTHGLNGIDALLTHAASGDVPAHLLRSSRGWAAQDWESALVSLRSRGWLTESEEPTFTEWGAAQRQEIEAQTDVLAAAPYAALGEEACAELRALARPWSKIFSDVLFR